jgi:RNA polymerase sigma-70 factor (ECF subfamily)
MIYYQALQRRMKLAARNHYSSLTIESCEQDAGASTVMEYDRSLEGMIGTTRLREMLNSLTEDQWETLRLHFFEGHTLSEIARARGQSVGNVRHHFYRGMEKLRSRIFRSELQDRTASGTR